MRAIVLYPGEDGYWVSECPSLPGCISQGRTKSEALDNVKEAIEGWLETAETHGQAIPEERFEVQVVLASGAPEGTLVRPGNASSASVAAVLDVQDEADTVHGKKKHVQVRR